MEGGGRRCSTSPGNLYAEDVLKDEFLRGGILTELEAQGAQVGGELADGLKGDSGHAQALRSFDVGWDIVNVEGFLGADLTGAKGFAEHERVRLAGAYPAGIDADGFGEVAKEIVSGFEMRDVDGVGIGKKAEAVALGKDFEEGVFMNGLGIEGTIPGLGELSEGEGCAEALGEVEVPIAGRDAAFLPIGPAGVIFDGGPDLRGRKRDALGKAFQRAAEIHTNEHAPDIENDGAQDRAGHGLFGLWFGKGGATFFCRVMGTEDADDGRKYGNKNNCPND